MDYIETRKLLLRGFIGFLAVTAVLAIICVVTDGFGETMVKMLVSTLSASYASLCAMSCIAFIEKRGANPVGVAGIAAAVVSAFMMILLVWGGYYSDGYMKIMMSLLVVAVGIAHALSLLIPDLEENHQWVQSGSSLAIMIVVSQIIAAMWLEIADEGYYKVLVVASIVAVALSLIVPICAKLKTRSLEAPETQTPESSDKLVLRLLSGKTYQNDAGKRFLVVEMPAEKGESSDG